ncbi:MAG: cupin domain-containing protein [Candidatus Vogelbacteria bacterium]|nr:cupin domain-containing protein [Candidatus Vogelbacteria bacterium]
MENLSNDAVSIAPHLHKVILENDKVRVLDVLVKPGDKAEMHTHPANVGIVTQAGTLNITFEDGTNKEVKLEKGAINFSGPNKHMVENKGTEEVRVIQVELK